jgi:hypothetical protein
MSWAERVRRAIARGRRGRLTEQTTKEERPTPDQVPDDVVVRAKDAFARRIPGDLAALVHDSLVDNEPPATDHRLRFEHPRMTIDVRISSAIEGSELSGQVEPPAPVALQLERDTAELTGPLDSSDGSFSFERIPSGIVRLRLTGQFGPSPVHTDWFRV